MKKNIRLIIICALVVIILAAALIILTTTGTTSDNNDDNPASSAADEVTTSLLYSNKMDDLAVLTIENEHGTYKVERVEFEGENLWTIKEIASLPLSNTVISALIENAISVTAQQTVAENPEDISIYGLDKPLFEQYTTYLLDIATKFDFGPSLKHRGRDVITVIGDGMKTSVQLGLFAAGLALVFGVVLGSIAALRRNKMVDRIIMVITTASISMPSFIMGTFLLLLFTVQLTLFPANGAEAGGLVLPIITLSLSPMANITRLTRSSMLDVLGQDYIRTAKAKGVSSFKMLFKHALRNAILPVITYVGPMLAYLMTGSFVVEKIFTIPGLGREFVSCITNRDYTMIMGTTIVLAVFIVIMNLVSDILYKVIDPRITLE